MLLKSPPHTGRIEVLARLFPGAKFIHIVRHPFALFPSTTRLWQSLDEVQGLQMPKGKGLEEYVFGCLTRMYGGFEEQRKRIDPAAIYDVRYEDLVADPVREIGKMYARLGLVITARCATRSPPSSRRRRNISRTSTGLTMR